MASSTAVPGFSLPASCVQALVDVSGIVALQLPRPNHFGAVVDISSCSRLVRTVVDKGCLVHEDSFGSLPDTDVPSLGIDTLVDAGVLACRLDEFGFATYAVDATQLEPQLEWPCVDSCPLLHAPLSETQSARDKLDLLLELCRQGWQGRFGQVPSIVLSANTFVFSYSMFDRSSAEKNVLFKVKDNIIFLNLSFYFSYLPSPS